MSYKVYDGFKFGTTDMDAVRSHIDAWKNELVKLHHRWLAALHADMAVAMVDEAATTTESRHRGKVPLEAVRKEIHDRQKEIVTSRLRDPEVDHEFVVSVFTHETGYYGIVGTERRAWLDEWLKSNFIEDFSYWNNTDRLDGMDADEWERRHAVWKSLASTDQIRFDCTVRDAVVTDAEVVAAAPDFETRTSREARRLAEMREFESRESTSRPEGDETGDARFQRLILIASRMSSWLNTEEGRDAREVASLHVREKIRPVIDEDVLMTPIEQHGPVAALAAPTTA
jgi:hypothetical protein